MSNINDHRMINEKRPSIAILHFDHKVWMNQISFYKLELKIFSEKLEEVASRNRNSEIHISIEQFQNRFIIQNNEMDILAHKIKLNEHQISVPHSKGPYLTSQEASENYAKIKDAIEEMNIICSELKEEFYKFLTKWM
jgi:hypothetical protein